MCYNIMIKKWHYLREESDFKTTSFIWIDTTSNICLIFMDIYAPPWGWITLVKEFSAAARIMQSSSKELRTLVADRV